MESIVLIVHVLLAAGVIGLVLLQRGKGADAGASFGAGASQTVFGSAGSANFLTRTTAILATLFFITSFTLAVISKQKAESEGDIGIPTPAVVETIQQQAAEQNAEPELPVDVEPAQIEDLPEINE